MINETNVELDILSTEYQIQLDQETDKINETILNQLTAIKQIVQINEDSVVLDLVKDEGFTKLVGEDVTQWVTNLDKHISRYEVESSTESAVVSAIIGGAVMKLLDKYFESIFQSKHDIKQRHKLIDVNKDISKIKVRSLIDHTSFMNGLKGTQQVVDSVTNFLKNPIANDIMGMVDALSKINFKMDDKYRWVVTSVGGSSKSFSAAYAHANVVSDSVLSVASSLGKVAFGGVVGVSMAVVPKIFKEISDQTAEQIGERGWSTGKDLKDVYSLWLSVATSMEQLDKLMKITASKKVANEHKDAVKTKLNIAKNAISVCYRLLKYSGNRVRGVPINSATVDKKAGDAEPKPEELPKKVEGEKETPKEPIKKPSEDDKPKDK